MRRYVVAQLVVAALLLCARAGWSAETEVTLEQVLALARERGPAVIAARARIEEAKGRRRAAGVLLRTNPEVELLVGPRWSTDEKFTDVEVHVGQTFELGGQRGARIRGAEAGVTREKASADDALRLLLRDVTIAFQRLLHARDALDLAQATEKVAQGIFDHTERRFQAGDLTALQRNLARIALGRLEAERLKAEANRLRAEAELKVLLGLGNGDTLRARGELRPRHHYDLKSLLARGADRADLRALAAEEREADADIALGRGLRWPELGLGVEAKQEGFDEVILAGLRLSLPIFERGQELRWTGQAKKARVSAEAAAQRSAVEVEIRAAYAAYALLDEAMGHYERDVLVSLDDNEVLAKKGFEAGQITVGEYLLLRREILEVRRAYLDQELELAIAAAELEARAGVTP